DQRQPPLCRAANQAIYFRSPQKQFPRPKRFVIHVITVRVWADVSIQQPYFTSLDKAVGVLEIYPSVSRGFDLGPRQNKTGFKLLDDFVVVECLPVYRNVLHGSAIAGIVVSRWLRTEQTVRWIALRRCPERSLRPERVCSTEWRRIHRLTVRRHRLSLILRDSIRERCIRLTRLNLILRGSIREQCVRLIHLARCRNRRIGQLLARPRIGDRSKRSLDHRRLLLLLLL